MPTKSRGNSWILATRDRFIRSGLERATSPLRVLGTSAGSICSERVLDQLEWDQRLCLPPFCTGGALPDQDPQRKGYSDVVLSSMNQPVLFSAAPGASVRHSKSPSVSRGYVGIPKRGPASVVDQRITPSNRLEAVYREQ